MEKNREGTCVALRLWGSLWLQEAERGGGVGAATVDTGEFRPMEGRREGRQGLEGRQVGVTGTRKLLEVQPAAPFRMCCSSGPSAGWCQDGHPGGQAPLPPPPAAWLLPRPVSPPSIWFI